MKNHTNKDNKRVIVCASGGIDSGVLLSSLKATNQKPIAVYVNLGQVAACREIQSLRNLAIHLDIPHEIIDFHDYAHLPVHPFLPNDKIPNGFYTVLSPIVYFAHLLEINTVAVGTTLEDTNKNKKLKPFFNKFTEAINLLNNDNELDPLDIVTPFENKSKHEILKIGLDLNFPFDKTYSCAGGGIHHCGKCDCCSERKAAFIKMESQDHTIYDI